MTSSLSWLVVRTHPQKEFEAEKQIRDCGYNALCPFEEKWRRQHSRTSHKRPWKYPHYTGYVFAGITGWSDWHHLKNDVRVIHRAPLGFLSRTDVDYLLTVSHRGSGEDFSVHKAIKTSGSAQIAEGSFHGNVVTVQSIVGKKAHVVVQLFNSMVPAEIPLAKLDPV